MKRKTKKQKTIQCTWQDYAAYLVAMGGCDPTEAVQKAKAEYRRQHGETPEEAINRLNLFFSDEQIWRRAARC